MTTQGVNSPLVSVVVPFHNSTTKADRLLMTLTTITDPDIEFVFVDDGSTDSTFAYLSERRKALSCRCTLLRQHNKGPGSARNSGFRAAKGKYVWFVDSDDNINPAVFGVVRQLEDCGYDFIDFGIQRFANARGPIRPSIGARVGELKLPEGAHDAEQVTRLFLLRHLGWLVTKVFRRDFLTVNAIRYPENCVSGDALLLFWLPLVVKKFYKSSVVGYLHHQERESITRSVGRKGARFYDRLTVAAMGVEKAATYPLDEKELRRVHGKFTNIFLVHTLEMLRESGDWRMFPRIIKFYQEETRRLGVRALPPTQMVRRLGLTVLLPWAASHVYPSQRGYFEHLHLTSWGRPIEP
jgi:glycosyltransferase involved in cell wall biosynthesis